MKYLSGFMNRNRFYLIHAELYAPIQHLISIISDAGISIIAAVDIPKFVFKEINNAERKYMNICLHPPIINLLAPPWQQLNVTLPPFVIPLIFRLAGPTPALVTAETVTKYFVAGDS